MQHINITANDGLKLGGYKWHLDNPKAIVVIVHGMAEHSARYDRFAKDLNENGYASVAVDLRGHGKSVEDGKKGYFVKKDGWRIVLDDIKVLVDFAKESYPDVPVILFGHSMGSIFSRVFMMDYGKEIDVCVLSGVTINKKGLRDIAPLITNIVALFGADKPSSLLNDMSFGEFNKQFEPARTAFDWISRDEDEVDKYIKDDMCGFACTPKLFNDVSKSILYTLKQDNIERIPKDLKTFIVSGEKDPAGSNGYDAKYLYESYKSTGVPVECKVYPDARHELLNEINRDEVTRDIISFLDSCVG